MQPREQPDVRAPADWRRVLEENEDERMGGGVVNRVTRPRLEPIDTNDERSPPWSRLRLEDGSFHLDGLPAAAIERRVDERAIQGRISRRRSDTASAHDPQRSAEAENTDRPPPQGGDESDGCDRASKCDRELEIPSRCQVRAGGERRARRDERPPHPRPPQPHSVG